MNWILAAGIFDQPWLVAALVIAGAIVNWLSQRRQAKQQQEAERTGDDATSESPEKAEQVLDVEEALRRLLGEERSQPKRMPPPIPPTARELPPTPPAGRRPGLSRASVSSPVAVTMPVVTGAVLEQAAERLTRIEAQVERPLVALPRKQRRAGDWDFLWRDRPNLRRAFVSSLVFGAPKGLEPRPGSSPVLTSWH